MLDEADIKNIIESITINVRNYLTVSDSEENSVIEITLPTKIGNIEKVDFSIYSRKININICKKLKKTK